MVSFGNKQITSLTRLNQGQKTTHQYPLEEHMVNQFCSILVSGATGWGKLEITREFDYSGGRTDIIAVNDNDHVIAFEVKRFDWHKALLQAYKNTSFAHCSYVVLPEVIARRAQLRIGEFKRRSVGICYLQGSNIHVIHLAICQKPIQPWLSRAAVLQTREKDGGTVEE